MIAILLLVVVVVALIALVYAGVGAGLWKKKTSPDADISQPDLIPPAQTEARHDPEPAEGERRFARSDETSREERERAVSRSDTDA